MPPITQADVIDASSANLQPADRILVDTNVWMNYAYPRASLSSPVAPVYGQFIMRARQSGSSLFVSVLTWAELAHVIEKTEYNLFKRRNQGISLKRFRQMPAERSGVIAQVSATWMQVTAVAMMLGILIDNSQMGHTINLFNSVSLDAYDVWIHRTMTENSVTSIFTDDRDFISVPGITVFTTNQGAINQARRDGKLIVL